MNPDIEEREVIQPEKWSYEEILEEADPQEEDEEEYDVFTDVVVPMVDE